MSSILISLDGRLSILMYHNRELRLYQTPEIQAVSDDSSLQLMRAAVAEPDAEINQFLEYLTNEEDVEIIPDGVCVNCGRSGERVKTNATK